MADKPQGLGLLHAVWLRREGTDAVVLVEDGGQWREIIRESLAGWPEIEFSHIKEPDLRVFHATPDPDACAHDWQGWREFEGGGERVCSKCGMGAMAHSLRTGP